MNDRKGNTSDVCLDFSQPSCKIREISQTETMLVVFCIISLFIVSGGPVFPPQCLLRVTS